MAKQEPASIRFKNPGAMWGNALAIKWGASKKAVVLKDGKGQGNNIAVFPTYVAGICAQLDLWRTSKNYRNKRFADAIAIWSGHNEVESYIAFVLKRVPGMTRSTVMDDAFWQSPSGVAFLKAQAWHEAGKKYPAPDADWIEAQRRVFDNDAPSQLVSNETAPVAPPPAEEGVRGDPELWNVQRRLKAMLYHSGGLDGIWGGLTSGAISGFINDRHRIDLNAPTSIEEFHVVQEQLKAEIGKAEAERFTRTIAPERAMATPAELAPKLPEVQASITAERGTFWSSIGLTISAAIAGIGKFTGEAVEWLNPLKTFVGDLPWPVWVGAAFAGAAALYVISRKSGDAKNAATQAFQEGARV